MGQAQQSHRYPITPGHVPKPDHAALSAFAVIEAGPAFMNLRFHLAYEYCLSYDPVCRNGTGAIPLLKHRFQALLPAAFWVNEFALLVLSKEFS